MKKRYLITFALLLIISCINRPSKLSENEIAEESYNYTLSDDLTTLKRKLKALAKLDTVQYGEVELYDDYFNGIITKLYLRADEKSSRFLTIITYNDSIKFIKVKLDQKHNLSINEVRKNERKYKQVLKKMIEQNYYKPLEFSYYKQIEGSDIYACTMTVSKSTEKKGYIACHIYSSPIKELEYLKFMVSNVMKNDTLGIYTQFITTN